MKAGVAGIALAIALAGCAGADGAHVRGPEFPTGEMIIHVENRQWAAMDIYIEGAIGAPQLVGTAPGRSRVAFPLPKSVLRGASEVRLIADPSGSTQRMISEPVDVEGSHDVEWEIRKSGLTRLVVM